MVARLYQEYRERIVPNLIKGLGKENKMAVPRIVKMVVNMGIGEGAGDFAAIEEAMMHLTAITGQKPVVTRAKKSIAGFKIRQGASVGIKVTLRGVRMYEFLDRMVNVALPRIRDFRGISRTSFDGHGNYSFGIMEQGVFPEVNLDKVKRPQGMDITIVTTAQNDKEAYELLKEFGMPFKREEQ